MRTLSVPALAAVALGLSLATVQSVAQSDDAGPSISSTHKAKVLGYEDPQTGVFHQVMRVTPEATTPALTGTITLTINITLKTTFAKGSVMVCSSMVDASTISMVTATGNTWMEEAFVTTPVNGSTATCVVSIPYSWLIPPSSATTINQISGDYTVSVINAPTTTTAASLTPLRTSSSTFLTTKTMPGTGATSKYTISAVL